MLSPGCDTIIEVIFIVENTCERGHILLCTYAVYTHLFWKGEVVASCLNLGRFSLIYFFVRSPMITEASVSPVDVCNEHGGAQRSGRFSLCFVETATSQR